MKALLDTNFIRNLEKAKNLCLMSDFVKKFDWQFYLPRIVNEELRKKTIPKKIQKLLENNLIKLESCNDLSYKKLSLMFFSLGEGELEAICIVDQCEDRTFKNYLILTDDKPAQKIASSLGMSSLGTPAFLFTANQNNLLDKVGLVKSLDFLEKNGFLIDPLVKEDIAKRML